MAKVTILIPIKLYRPNTLFIKPTTPRKENYMVSLPSLVFPLDTITPLLKEMKTNPPTKLFWPGKILVAALPVSMRLWPLKKLGFKLL